MSDYRLACLRREAAQGGASERARYVRALEQAVGLPVEPELVQEVPLETAEPATEEQRERIEAWYQRARDGVESVDGFIAELGAIHHDYGTIVHAMAAAAIAACWKMDRTPAGGITGFQAGCVMWQFILRWGSVDAPARILDFTKMLYPQHADQFACTLARSSWETIQSKARTLVERPVLHPEVREHMERIVAGEVPFGWTVRDDEE